MSLVIFVSTKTVIISKYKQEFPFKPPEENLSKAAFGAYQLLRQSESIQIESTRDEREEAITLLRRYGLALYNAIIPAAFQSKLQQAGGVFIYTMDPEIVQIPWELLYDGSSFFSLTQGVVRINNSNAKTVPELNLDSQEFLRICLSACSPIPPIFPGNRFIHYMEAFSTGSFSQSSLVDVHVNGNSSRNSVLNDLQNHPNVFLFSGHETEKGWILKGENGYSDCIDWHKNELDPALKEAVANGLRILVLVTSLMLKGKDPNRTDPLSRYFDLGIPYIISVHGRIARHRFQEYFQNFILGLMREENILRAHRQAINCIFSSLPLSWDWSWIQLHLNQRLLEQKSESPLPPFRFFQNGEESRLTRRQPPNLSFLNARRFSGSSEVINRISDHLLSEGNSEILYLKTSTGSPLEEYIQEFLRRLAPESTFQKSVLYYQRWGYHKKQQEKLPATPIGNLFPFYFGHKNVGTYFDQYLITDPQTKSVEAAFRFLLVYYPPERYDASFDDWLSKNQKKGWRIIFLSDGSAFTKLPMVTISTNSLTASEVSNAFEDDLPEPWIDLVKDPLPAHLQNLALLKIAQHSGNEQIMELFKQEKSLEKLWKKTLLSVFSELSAQRLKIFLILYLMRVNCARSFLAELLGVKNIEVDLNYLLRLHLISTNLTDAHVWIPINLYLVVDQYELINQNQLLSFGLELLKRQIALLRGPSFPNTDRICGFQYCINSLAHMGDIANPLQRNLQYGRKLSRLPGAPPALFYPNICTSMEMVLATGGKHEIQKVLFSILDIIGNLPLERHSIRIYQWILKNEEQQKNWPQVSELLMKLASVYMRLSMKEKAIGLITSAIKLNTDIRNFTHRYQNLITISLILLDLGEFRKVKSIITSSDFDLTKLNESDIARLWLIDGHLLFQSNKLEEAAKSFKKVLKIPKLPISNSLLAKTHLNLADIYRTGHEQKNFYTHLNKAAAFFEKAGKVLQSAELHEQLLDMCLTSNMNEDAIR
ncbi:MAG: hypothetical protein HQ517_14200, partial [SAR324 cluster bacterium]|nr:hypothetical protein [SAR324 cluster bacterium]